MLRWIFSLQICASLSVGAQEARRQYACLSKMPEHSRCIAPTCPRLLQVMPEDVSPRDYHDKDQGAQRDGFEIVFEYRRVHARPPLRHSVIDKPDCLPRQLEQKYRKHLQWVAEPETGKHPHSGEQARDYPSRRGLVAYRLRQKRDAATDD